VRTCRAWVGCGPEQRRTGTCSVSRSITMPCVWPWNGPSLTPGSHVLNAHGRSACDRTVAEIDEVRFGIEPPRQVRCRSANVAMYSPSRPGTTEKIRKKNKQVIDPVALGLVVLVGGEPIRSDHRPSRWRLTRYRGARLPGGTPGCGEIRNAALTSVFLRPHNPGLVVALPLTDDSLIPASRPGPCWALLSSALPAWVSPPV